MRQVQIFLAALSQQSKETVMERMEDVIELGTATIETKGQFGQGIDEVRRQLAAGLSED
jgi:hypothetical protein